MKIIEVVFKIVVSEVIRKDFKKREVRAIRGEKRRKVKKMREKKNVFLRQGPLIED